MKRTDRHGLPEVITESILRTEAGERAFARGAAYFESGAVAGLVVSAETLNARVVGGDEYAVQLWNEDGALGHSCTCPVGDDGVFCKHGVAAGLAWLAGRKAVPPAQRGRDDLAGIREWLAGAPREQLVELLIEQTLNDPGLRSRLDARAARVAATQRVDVKTLKQTIGKALAVSGFVDYHGMRRLIQRAYPAVELIAGLIEDGHAQAAVELAHYALKRGIAVYERTDDSGGGFGDLLRQIAELHLKACRAAPPEPASFGKQFFDLVLSDDWGLVAFEDYAPLLGEPGLRVFRALAKKEWQKVPARGLPARLPVRRTQTGRAQAGPAESESRSSASYYRITSIMESLAREANDTDALVAIKSRDLTLPYHFLEIANVLAEAGRRDEALAWAERGHKAFPDRPDSRLVDFLADEYARRGRHDEAIALTWEQFKQQPALASYQRLKVCTERAGAWNEWRAKALDWIREKFRKEIPTNSLSLRERAGVREVFRYNTHPRYLGGHSLLVEIFLWERDSDAALAEAKTGGCTESLWFAVAEAREAKHPEDAVAIYQARLDTIVNQANNRAYDEAAALVARVRGLMRRTKQEKEFAAWLEAVRIKHKAKRNFMQRLDKTLHKR